MARTPPSRVSTGKVLRELRAAARKGDRAALAVALDQMRTLALSPRTGSATSGSCAIRSPAWSICS